MLLVLKLLANMGNMGKAAAKRDFGLGKGLLLIRSDRMKYANEINMNILEKDKKKRKASY